MEEKLSGDLGRHLERGGGFQTIPAMRPGELGEDVVLFSSIIMTTRHDLTRRMNLSSLFFFSHGVSINRYSRIALTQTLAWLPLFAAPYYGSPTPTYKEANRRRSALWAGKVGPDPRS